MRPDWRHDTRSLLVGCFDFFFSFFVLFFPPNGGGRGGAARCVKRDVALTTFLPSHVISPGCVTGRSQKGMGGVMMRLSDSRTLQRRKHLKRRDCDA